VASDQFGQGVPDVLSQLQGRVQHGADMEPVTVWYQIEVQSQDRWEPLFGKFNSRADAEQQARQTVTRAAEWGGLRARVVKITQTAEIVVEEFRQ